MAVLELFFLICIKKNSFN